MGKHALTLKLALLASALLTLGLHQAADAETAKVTASVLKMRSGPSTRYRTIARFKRGTRAEIVSKAKHPWWKIKVGDRVGYVHSHYLHVIERQGLTGVLDDPSENAPEEAESAAKPIDKARVDASRLRMRAGPSSNTKSLGSLPRGSKVDVLDKSDGRWWKVRTPEGKEGYMYSPYLGRTSDLIADPIKADDPAPNPGTAIVTNLPGDPVVVLGRHARVSQRAIRVLKDIMRAAGVPRCTITSGRRTPTDQARAMYQLLRNNGTAYGYRLYGWGGDQVIRTYAIARAAGKSSAATQRAMVETINRIGPSRVSKHCRATGDVFDVAPSSIARKTAFVRELKRARSVGTITKLILPPSDPAYHIELR